MSDSLIDTLTSERNKAHQRIAELESALRGLLNSIEPVYIGDEHNDAYECPHCLGTGYVNNYSLIAHHDDCPYLIGKQILKDQNHE